MQNIKAIAVIFVAPKSECNICRPKLEQCKEKYEVTLIYFPRVKSDLKLEMNFQIPLVALWTRDKISLVNLESNYII